MVQDSDKHPMTHTASASLSGSQSAPSVPTQPSASMWSNDASRALPHLLVFGEALTDFVHRGDGQWQSAAGGACWNVARVAAVLGIHTGWGGAVSNDPFGQEIINLSARANLDARYLQVVDKAPLIAMVHRTNPPEYGFLGNDSADLAFDESLLPAGWEAACSLAHFGCISLVRQPLGARLTAIARRLRDGGARISFDANYRNLMGPDYPAYFEDMVAHADIVKVSDEDLSRIYPHREPQTSLDAVLAMMQAPPPARAAGHSPFSTADRMVLYTRGAEGMTLFSGKQRIVQNAITVAVSDTVGAGDACIGGLLASLLLHPEEPLPVHVRFAAATAACACMHTGAHAPTRAEVDALLHADTAMQGAA